MVRVFAAATKLGDGAACSAMAERRCSVSTRGGGDGNENWAGELVGQARGGFKHWPAMPGWPRHMAAWLDGRRWVAPHGGGFLKPVRYCSMPETSIQLTFDA